MSRMTLRKVELRGGHRDGEIVEVYDCVSEFQQVFIGTHGAGYHRWREVAGQNKDGLDIFLYIGILQGAGL